MNAYYTEPTMNQWLESSDREELNALYFYAQKVGVSRAIIEFSARLCYNSLAKLGHAPNFVEKVLTDGHLSVSEHYTLFFHVDGQKHVTGEKRIYTKPLLTYEMLQQTYKRNRYVEATGNSVWGNQRALSEGLGDRSEPYKIFSTIMAQQYPTLYVPGNRFDSTINETNVNLYVPGQENVKLLCHNRGTLNNTKKILSSDPRFRYGSFTFLVEGISRAAANQLARHRGASLSQESQRYVKALNAEFVYPNDNPLFAEAYKVSMQYYEKLLKEGVKKEDARFVLPNGIATRMVVTFYYREFIHFLRMRLHKHAQWEIRNNVARQMYEQALLCGNLSAKELGGLQDELGIDG